MVFTNANIFDRKWEEIDHDLEDSVAGALTSPTGVEGEGDPLGLGAIIECVFHPDMCCLLSEPKSV
jgi:hypothetical protein